MTAWLGVDVGATRKGFDVAVIDERRLLAGNRVCNVGKPERYQQVRTNANPFPPEKHEQKVIGQNQRELDIIQGYSGHITSTQTFYNTQDSYAVFLRAINGGGFLLRFVPPTPKNSKVKVVPAPDDERGQCPLSTRDIFELDQDGSSISRLWTSACGGTFGGNPGLMQTLFQTQIPDYPKLVSTVKL